MSDHIELTAELRTDMGKGASRRLRRNADLVPAVIYGAGKDAVALSIAHKDLKKATEHEAFFSQIITIVTGGESTPAIIKDLQRHPAKDRILHADFFRVRMDQEITVEVPLHFIGEEQCVGVRLNNGQVQHNMTSLQISCLPGNLPEYIEIDVSNLDVGDAIHMSEIKLAEGLDIPELHLGEDHDQVVVSIHERHVASAEDEESAAPEPEAPASDDDEDESED
ncbi:MAG: 50S ribosomal protein L25/general stress protein Ctc [Pseudomonadales bacterium]|nr:50S ribosomal protein L25/general stress protein Ctc [Pseudomonadales bacterium]